MYEWLQGRAAGEDDPGNSLQRMLGEVGEQAEMFGIYGPLLQFMGRTNCFNEEFGYDVRAGTLAFDMLTARVLPSPWRTDLARYLDPVRRRSSDSPLPDFYNNRFHNKNRTLKILTRFRVPPRVPL